MLSDSTRAVIERLVEALVPFCDEGEDQPSLNSNQLDAVLAEARKLLEEPASEDAWLVEADRLINELAGSAIGMYAEELVNARHDLRAHLRSRPAPEGFVLVPVEPTVAMLTAGSAAIDSAEDVGVIPQSIPQADAAWKAMIEAAKESGK